ncbi:hypothetical protein [Trichococcus patagoniensis]|uniref:hypothetical protein n=1 Tax=Trichococcus patagoniensis TaxID=382641 RepID=UPI000D3CD880
MTKNIAEEVPITIQLFLWSLIDDHVSCGNQLDYSPKCELRAKRKRPRNLMLSVIVSMVAFSEKGIPLGGKHGLYP